MGGEELLVGEEAAVGHVHGDGAVEVVGDPSHGFRLQQDLVVALGQRQPLHGPVETDVCLFVHILYFLCKDNNSEISKSAVKRMCFTLITLQTLSPKSLPG